MKNRRAALGMICVALAMVWSAGAAWADLYTFTFEGSYSSVNGSSSDLGKGEDSGDTGDPDDPPPPEEKSLFVATKGMADTAATLNVTIDVTSSDYWNEWDAGVLLEHLDALGTVLGWQVITPGGTFNYDATNFVSGYAISRNEAEASAVYTEPLPGTVYPIAGTASAEVRGYDENLMTGYRSGAAAWLDVEYDAVSQAAVATGFMGDFWEQFSPATGSVSADNYCGYAFSGVLTGWENATIVPEPASMMLLSLGISLLAARKIRKRI